MASLLKYGLLALASAASLLTVNSARAEQYTIDGFNIGQSIDPNSSNYRSYSCKPSEQFADTVDCQRKQQKSAGSSAAIVSNTLIHTQDGSLIYGVSDITPLTMSSAEVQGEIDGLSREIGAKPSSNDRQEQNGQGVTALVIATWGAVKLEDVTGADLDTLAAGGSLPLGLSLDPLGNPKLSVDQYLPISRITGGIGYIYYATIEKNGRVHRRFIAIDPKRVATAQFRTSLQNILKKDSALPRDDFSLWPEIAWIARNLARDTSTTTATSLLDAGFEQGHSTKLRSQIWALLPFGAISRLAADQYSRMDIYGPSTQYPQVRQDIQKFLAEHPSDPFVSFAYYLLGDYDKALQANPNSPIKDVLHYGAGYKILEALMQGLLPVLKARITPATPQEFHDSIDSLLDEKPETDDHVNAVLRVADGVWKSSDRRPFADALPGFAAQAAIAQKHFAVVVLNPKSSIADDAAFMLGWLDLQMGKTDEALANFSQALVIGNGDYKPSAIWGTIRLMEGMPARQQLSMVSGNQVFSQQTPLWYEAARTAYRNFDRPLTIEAAKEALRAFKIPFDDLPVTTDPDRITDAIEKINSNLSEDPNVTELPYLIEASKEMADYETYLKDVGKQSPEAFAARAKKTILKYAMLVDPPELRPGRPKPPPVHKDLRQALHLIDLTLEATPKEPRYAQLREWLRFRAVRATVFYAPDHMPQAIAALEEEFPSSKLLDDAMAEQVFADGIMLKNPDAADEAFHALLSKYPQGNAVDNAYSWMAIIMRCSNRLDEEKRLNAEIIKRFPLTRHAKYARERMAHPDECGL